MNVFKKALTLPLIVALFSSFFVFGYTAYAENWDNARIDKLLEKWPAVESIAKFRGTTGEFYNNFSEVFTAPSVDRRDQLIRAITCVSQNLFGEIEAETIGQALTNNYMLSTAEHHSSIANPETFNVLLNHYLIQRNHNLPLVTMSCSTVPINNYCFPRGIVYKDSKIPFLPTSCKDLFVSHAPNIQPKCFNNKISELLKEKKISSEEVQILNTFLNNELKSISHLDSFSSQISVLNRRLCKTMIDPSLHYPGFDYFMIPFEKIVEKMVYNDFMSSNHSWVYKVIFDTFLRNKLYEILNGVRICWNKNINKGTFLFWGIGQNKRPIGLFLKDERLVSECGSINVKLEQTEILNALRNGQIIPAPNLMFLYIFYAGINPLGGALQINYLPEIKSKLINGNPLNLSSEDLNIIKATRTDLYVNFQTQKCTVGGLTKVWDKLTAEQLNKYENSSHFDQIEEILCFLEDQAK